jgi:hypothetical protein
MLHPLPHVASQPSIFHGNPRRHRCSPSSSAARTLSRGLKAQQRSTTTDTPPNGLLPQTLNTNHARHFTAWQHKRVYRTRGQHEQCISGLSLPLSIPEGHGRSNHSEQTPITHETRTVKITIHPPAVCRHGSQTLNHFDFEHTVTCQTQGSRGRPTHITECPQGIAAVDISLKTAQVPFEHDSSGKQQVQYHNPTLPHLLSSIMQPAT